MLRASFEDTWQYEVTDDIALSISRELLEANIKSC